MFKPPAERSLSGSGFGGAPKNTSDNLFSTDAVEVVLGVSEGPIKGLADGAKSFYVGETPLENATGESNFEEFDLAIYEGSPLGQVIQSKLGGFGSSTTVSTELASDTPVVRQGLQTDIDYLDIRLVINRLLKETNKGSFEHTGRVKIEWKAESAVDWLTSTTTLTDPPPAFQSSTGVVQYYGSKAQNESGVTPSADDRVVFRDTVAPTTTAVRAVWFDSDDSDRPYIRTDDAWVAPGSLLAGSVGGFTTWTWTESVNRPVMRHSAMDGSIYVDNWVTEAARVFVSPTTPSTNAVAKDFWVNTTDGKVYLFNGTTWIVAGSSLVPGAFDTASTAPVSGEITITGKTSSAYVKELRLPVARIAEPYQIRVTKLNPVNTDELFFDVTWESFQEVNKDPFNFTSLAVAHINGRASEQFSSVPDFSGVYDGRIVKVPSNYDPDTRLYTGVWDGTWVLAYTNNPAFIALDLVENDLYGMNAYYPVSVNKWDVYDAGQWCDTLNEDGRPRFTFNMLLSDPRGGREAVDFICGTFGGRFFDDGNGFATIKIDRDGEAVALFTPENIADGVFSYSFTDTMTRHNDVTVTFINPDLNWQEDRRRVYEQDHIDQYGRIPLNFVAVGCTDPDEAIARGRYKLVTGTTEHTIVTFKTNRLGLYMSPYDIILISDDEMAGGLTGRVKDVGVNSFTLRDPLFLEDGFSYNAVFQVVNTETADYEMVTIALTPGQTGVNLTSINLVSGLPAGLPDKAVFTIETTDGTAAPRAFRVMTLGEADGNPDLVDITAIAINRSKWAYVDGLIEFGDTVEHFDVRINARPAPVPALRITASTAKVGNKDTHSLALDWDASPSTVVQKYRVFSSRDNSPPLLLAELSGRKLDLHDVALGEYVFHVVAVAVTGRESAPTFAQHRLIGDYKEVAGLTGLRLADEPFEFIFESRSPRFAWDASTSPEHDVYVVQVLDQADVLLRQVESVNNSFVYEFDHNSADNGGSPTRVFKVQVASRDQFGYLSQFTQIAVTNPAPAALVNQEATPFFDSVLIEYDLSSARDFTGVLVHVSEVSGFTPGPGNLFYRGLSNNLVMPADQGTTYYFKIAPFDMFGETELNYGDELAATTYSSSFDSDPPATPVGLGLTSIVDTADPGFVKLTAAWTANVEADFAYYDLQIKEGAGGWTSHQGSEITRVFRVRPNIAFQAKIRAVDALGNKSVFSTIVNHTSAVDTVAPVVPTGLVTTGGFEVIWLKWNANSEPDLAHYEIYQSTVTTAPLVGTAATYTASANSLPVTGFTGAVTRHFWIRAVDTSGNKSAWSARVQGDTAILATPDIAGIIDLTSFASSLTAPGIGATLPATPFGATTPKTFYLTTDKALYVQKTDASGWVKQTDATLIAGQIIAGQIEAGAIGTDQLAANAIVASKMLLTNTSNLISNGTFQTGGLHDWYSPVGAVVQASVEGITAPTKYVAKFTATGTASVALTSGDQPASLGKGFTVETGEQYFFSVSAAKTGADFSVTPVVYVYWFKKDGTSGTTALFGIPVAASSTFTTYSGSYTVPADVERMFFYLYGNASGGGKLYVTNITVRKKQDANLIVDGSINAAKLSAGEIITLSAQIKDAIISSAKIIDLDASKITAGSVLSSEVIVSGRSIGSIASLNLLSDNMDGAAWTTHVGAGTFTQGSTGNTGSNNGAVHATPGNGLVWATGPEQIPYDPGKLHKITFRVLRSTGGVVTGSMYLGVAGVGIDGVTPVAAYGGGASFSATQIYCAASSMDQSEVPTSFTEYVGYFKGKAALGVPNAGTAASPSVLHQDVYHVRPLAIFNYNLASGGAGMYLDSVKIEQIDENAAEIVNAGSTKINPGMVLISGGTTLTNWRQGGDETKIAGGSLSANTVDANKLTIGSRGIIVEAIEFEANSVSTNRLSWSAGTITYTDDAGATITQAISASAVNWTTGTRYIYWTKGTAVLTSTITPATANASDNVILATYRGGTNLVTNYGRTIIDGDHIKTGTVTATQVDATSIRGAILIADAVKAVHIEANSITSRHMVLSDTSNLLAAPTFMNNDGTVAAAAWVPSGHCSLAGTAYNVNSPYAIIGNLTGTPSTGYATNVNEYIPCIAGDQFKLTAEIYTNTTTGTVRAYLWFYDKAGASLGFDYLGWGLVESFVRKTKIVTAPAGAAKCKFIYENFLCAGVATYLTFAGVYRAANAELIVDGAITAVKIGAGEINGTHVAADTLTARHVQIGSEGNIVSFDPHWRDTEFWEDQSGFDLVNSSHVTAPGKALETFQSGTHLWDEVRWPVDINKDYELEIVAYMSSTSARLYGVWRFFDYQGTPITGVTAAGWPASNTTAGNYYHPANTPGTLGYETYKLSVGPNSTAKMPTGAKFCSFGLLPNYGSTAYRLLINRIWMSEKTNGSLIVDGTITATHLNVSSLSAISATLGNVNISSAVIGTLTVGTSNIADSAVSDVVSINGSSVSFSSETTVMSLVVPNSLNKRTTIISDGVITPFANNTGATMTLTLKLKRGTTVLRTTTLSMTEVDTLPKIPFSLNFSDVSPGAGTHTYSVTATRSGGTASSVDNPFMVAMVLKK